MVSTKKLNKKTYTKDGKKINAVDIMPVAEATDIPMLLYPFLNEKDNWIAFDQRKLFTYDARTDSFDHRRVTDLDFNDTRNDLCGLWSVGYQSEIKNIKLPMIAFGNWISGLITHSLGLGDYEKASINMLAVIYYSRLFSNDPINQDEELSLLKVKLQGTLYSEEILESVYSKSLEMNSIKDFCQLVSTVTGSLRLSKFDLGALYHLTKTGWMGVDNKENIIVALEYPPIWIAMCYSSLKRNFYNKTTIGDAVARISKRGAGEEFVANVDSLIRTGVVVE